MRTGPTLDTGAFVSIVYDFTMDDRTIPPFYFESEDSAMCWTSFHVGMVDRSRGRRNQLVTAPDIGRLSVIPIDLTIATDSRKHLIISGGHPMRHVMFLSTLGAGDMEVASSKTRRYTCCNEGIRDVSTSSGWAMFELRCKQRVGDR